MDGGVRSLDLHGMNAWQARTAVDAALRRSGGLYRLRLVHGFNRGTALRDMLRTEYAAHPKVLRLVSVSEGVTDLVLREF